MLQSKTLCSTDTNSVLVIEDDDNTRWRLSEIIGTHPQLQVAAAVENYWKACQYLRHRATPDVMLIDLGLPDGSGIDLIRECRKYHKRSEVMVLTVFGDERHVVAAIEAGATGYLLKDEDPFFIGDAIIDLLAGNSPISAAIARHVLKRVQLRDIQSNDSSENQPALTKREREILELIARGFTYTEIARMLSISVNTVTSHIQNTYRKMEVKSRSEAVFEAVQMGIIQLT